jgi:hypothetical protein
MVVDGECLEALLILLQFFSGNHLGYMGLKLSITR